ncbi:MAG TPA: Uma2 family endonuclease [Chloroflexia bacterium]|nr:Uma2 family endonuclease [Chloroflexia bacterium]
MAIQLTRKQFSIDEYERMIEGGVFDKEDRLELIRGEIVEMALIGLRHAACVARLDALFHEQVSRKAIIWVQNPINLYGGSAPQPDVVLLRPRNDYYASARPTPSDVFLLVEVAESSLAADRGVKLPLYAEAGVGEVWIVNLGQNTVEVYSNPRGNAYQNVRRATKGEVLELPAGLHGTVEVNNIVG